MVAATEDEYDKLFQPPNWREYWKSRYDEYLMDVDVLLAELLHDESKQLPTAPLTTTIGSTGGKNARRPDLPIQEPDLGWLDEVDEL